MQLVNFDDTLRVKTVQGVVLGQDTLADLERKCGTDYKVRTSLWGAEEMYSLAIIYPTGGEDSLALRFVFDLTAADRADPPAGYEQWLQRVQTAARKGNRREVKRLLGKHTTHSVELLSYDDAMRPE